MRPVKAIDAGSAVLTGVAAVVVLFSRRRYLKWGATDEEVDIALPGDAILAPADLTATRAVTVHAAADDVWPWIAQLGQGRAGFYSYDFLENMVGCNIHSADRIVAEWQVIEVGDQVNLYPAVGLSVAHVEPGRALVLRGGLPMGPGRQPPYDFTWAFALNTGPGDTTRLIVRERYRYSRRWAALLIEPVSLISFVMSQRMLRGIRERAERQTSAARSRPVGDETVRELPRRHGFGGRNDVGSRVRIEY
jgi:hypothetical protein